MFKPIAIPGFEHYEVNVEAVLRNTRTGKTVKGWLNEQNYRRVELRDGKKRSAQYLHRIVALTWIPNDDPENKIEVNHLNKVRQDCRAINLEWVSHAQNMAYIYSEPFVKPLDECPF